MSILIFDVEQFRLEFPAFANPTDFPEETLQMYWDSATCYISDCANYGWLVNGCRQQALNLMTAHLAALAVLIAMGKNPGYVQNATIDKISVGLTPPPIKNEYQWWLMSTPYGTRLYALLSAKSVGGWYIGGSPESAGFRKVGGIF